MIGQLVGGILGKVSGPSLLWIILGLSSALAVESVLLKKAWEKNAQAVLQCDNEKQADALEASNRVNAELIQIRQERDNARLRADLAETKTDLEIEKRIALRDQEHAKEIAEFATLKNEVDDEEFFCATEPVAAGQLAGMRDAATGYNEARNRSRTAGPLPVDST